MIDLGRPVLKAGIIIYRYTVSYFLGRRCRHLPTCSEYALEALDRHGSWRGGWLMLSRIVRCRPGGSSGFDPVPEHLSATYPIWQGWKYGIWKVEENKEAEHGDDRAAASHEH